MDDVQQFLDSLSKNPFFEPAQVKRNKRNQRPICIAIDTVLRDGGIEDYTKYREYLLTLAYRYGRKFYNVEPDYMGILVGYALAKLPDALAAHDSTRAPMDFYLKRWMLFLVKDGLKTLARQVDHFDREFDLGEDCEFITDNSTEERHNADELEEYLQSLYLVAGLTDAEQKVFQWIEREGFTHTEVQRVFGARSRSTVTTLLANAKVKLRKVLGDDPKSVIFR